MFEPQTPESSQWHVGLFPIIFRMCFQLLGALIKLLWILTQHIAEKDDLPMEIRMRNELDRLLVKRASPQRNKTDIRCRKAALPMIIAVVVSLSSTAPSKKTPLT